MNPLPLVAALAASLAAASPPAPPLAPAPAEPAPYAPGPTCAGEYADDLQALAAAAREFESRQAPYTYCVRSTATYECPSYAGDGSLRKTRRKVVSHGTAFGYRQQAGETLLVTNDHVSEWPAVTGEEHVVEDVPAGCKRVASALRIVDDEADAYERDDVALSRVVSDPQLDVSVVRAKGTLPVLPWKIGRSGGLRERNVVDVRGFPLGVLRANNVGKVVSTFVHDDAHDWDHDDFVIDALLSPGSSGSPVLAVSCRTGEFELVGVYHARYTRAGALHVVVGVDQVRDLLATLKRSPRGVAEVAGVADDGARARLAADAAQALEPFFPFGGVTAAVRARGDGALVFELMSKDFPVTAHPALVLEDLPPAADDAASGRLGRVWAGNRQGLREVPEAAIDADARALLVKALEALRRDAGAAFAYRDATRSGMGTREGFQEVKRLERALRRAATSRQDVAQAALELSEQLCPRFADATGSVADALVPPTPEAPREYAWRPVLHEAPGPAVVPIPHAPAPPAR
jgi:serine protease Do